MAKRKGTSIARGLQSVGQKTNGVMVPKSSNKRRRDETGTRRWRAGISSFCVLERTHWDAQRVVPNRGQPMNAAAAEAIRRLRSADCRSRCY
jgi:hypothetical protein